jgi:hypothetical protein
MADDREGYQHRQPQLGAMLWIGKRQQAGGFVLHKAKPPSRPSPAAVMQSLPTRH